MTTHVVHSLRFSLPATDYSEAVSRQSTARHWALHSLAPILNGYLEELAGGDEVILIEKVELNIADFPWNLSEELWQQKLATAIRLTNASGNTPMLILKQWFFYLQYGSFERTAIVPSIAAIESYLLSHRQQLPSPFMQQFSQRLTAAFLQRLLLSQSEKLIEFFLEKGLGVEASELPEVLQAIRRSTTDKIDKVIV